MYIGKKSRHFKKPLARKLQRLSWGRLEMWRWAINQLVSKLSEFDVCRRFIALITRSVFYWLGSSESRKPAGQGQGDLSLEKREMVFPGSEDNSGRVLRVQR